MRACGPALAMVLAAAPLSAEVLISGPEVVDGAGGGTQASPWQLNDSLLVEGDESAVLTIRNGGVMTVNNHQAVIADSADTQGRVVVTGAGSRWEVLGDWELYVGGAGAGELYIADGASVRIPSEDGWFGGELYIGYDPGGQGLVTVTGEDASLEVTTLISVGWAGEGELRIADGGLVEAGQVNLADGGGPGRLWVTGADSRLAVTGYLIAGWAGEGRLLVEEGGRIETGGLVLAAERWASAEALVTGPGSLVASEELTVGDGGQALLRVADGGGLRIDRSTILGWDDRGRGAVTIAGAGSHWDNGSWLVIGWWGEGSVTLTDGGRLSVGDGQGGAGEIYLGNEAGAEGRLIIGAEDAPAAAGVLEAGVVVFSDGDGTLLFNHDETAYVFDTALVSEGTGAHQIVHAGGVTLLTGDSTLFAGTTTLAGGTLLVGDGQSGALGGDLDVQAGGLLGGSGTLGTAGSAVTIAAGGVHAPGNSIGVQRVLGDYENRGVLQIEATPDAADRLVVDGAIDIAGATLELLLSPGEATAWSLSNGPFTIIENQGGQDVTGHFATVTRNLLFLDPLLDYAGGASGRDVTLELVRNDIAVESVARTRNQIATAGALDSLPQDHAAAAAILTMGDPALVRQGLDALSGELHASLRTALLEESRFLRWAVRQRLGAALAGPAAGPQFAGVPQLSDADPVSPPDGGGPVFWSHGFGSWGSSDGDGNAARLERDTAGLLLGADLALDGWRLGLLAGYSHGSLDLPARASSATGDSYHLGLYGGRAWGELSLTAGLTYSWHSLDSKRQVALPGLAETLKADYGATTLQLTGELAYGLSAGALRLEPFAGLAYLRLDSEGFHESGGAAALRVKGQDSDLGLSTLGLRLALPLALGEVEGRLGALAGWRHAMGALTPKTQQAFAGSDSFTVAGVPLARDVALLEAGLELDLAPGMTLGVAYQGQIAAEARDHGLVARFSLAF